MSTNSQKKFLINSVPIFESLDSGETETLSKYLSPKELQTGGIVCKEGQHASFLCFVTIGELEIIKKIDGKEVVIATIKEGGTLVEMALIDGMTRSATVRALSETIVLILRRNDFDELLEEHPKIGIKILKGIARGMSFNLRQTSAQISAYMTISQ